MTKEEKKLLLIDLLARLPYGVKIRLGDYDYQVCGYNSEKELPVKIWYYYDSNITLKSYIDVYLTDYRPYLRPISSMTEEEKEELRFTYDFLYSDYPFDDEEEDEDEDSIEGHYEPSDETFDWYNKKMFDYRGLIEKGLAIEAPNDMYKI